MAKLTKAQMREAGVLNSYDFYGDTPYLDHRSPHGHRDVTPAAWYVVKRGERLESRWWTNGTKWFSHTGTKLADGERGGQAALDEALAWASERFGITEWVRGPFGTFGPADFVQARYDELRGR